MPLFLADSKGCRQVPDYQVGKAVASSTTIVAISTTASMKRLKLIIAQAFTQFETVSVGQTIASSNRLVMVIWRGYQQQEFTAMNFATGPGGITRGRQG